jgi:histone H2B
MPRTRKPPAKAPPKSTEKATTAPGGNKNVNVVKKGKRHRKRSYASMQTWIYKMLKEKHPDLAMGSQCMQVLNAIYYDLFDRLVREAARLSDAAHRKTLSSRDVISAVRLLFPKDLAKYGVHAVQKALHHYQTSTLEPAVPVVPLGLAPPPPEPK